MSYKEDQIKNWKDRKHRFFRRPRNVEDWDAVSARFIHIVCNDPDLDFRISRLCNLFAADMPSTYGGYAHHGH